MARIRTIKPELWTDERLTECSLSARLLFIGMLNFADDNGNMRHSPKRLKMQVFPADNIDTAPLLEELLAQGVVVAYSVSDEHYLHLKGFKKHQVINRPSKTDIPQPSFIEKDETDSDEGEDHSLNAHGEVSDGREGNGKEGIREAKASSSAAALPDCPHAELIDLFAAKLPMLPQPKPELWSGARAKALKARWVWVLTAKKRNGDRYATDKQSAIDFFARFFDYVSGSDFLSGRNGQWTGCDLAWLANETNFAKVMQGNYDNKEAA